MARLIKLRIDTNFEQEQTEQTEQTEGTERPEMLLSGVLAVYVRCLGGGNGLCPGTNEGHV